QLDLRNDPEAHRRAGHLRMLDVRSDAWSGADRKFQAHVDAVLKMYGAPAISQIPGSDVEPTNYDRAAWRRVARDMLADWLDLDPFIFGDLKGLLQSFSNLMDMASGGNAVFRYETSARHIACVLVNTQHPGLIRAKRTGRPNQLSPLRLSQLLLDHESGKV